MTSKPPKVTVLALAYNHAKYLMSTLESIRSQTFQDFQLFISDDASSDHSANLIRDWNAVHGRADRLFLHSQNIGLCPTLNEMLSLASGEYIQMIACDDVLQPRCLERKVKALNRAPRNVAAVYSDALIINAAGEIQPNTFMQKFRKNDPAETKDLFPRLLHGNFLPAMSVLFRRACLDEVGAFDEGLSFEDWDLWLRLSRRFDFVFDDMPSVQYRLHQSNMHRNMKNEALQNYRILSKHRDILRARMRIMLTIVRNSDQFGTDTAELRDFLTWADDYPETRWFRHSYIGRGKLARATVSRIVSTSEGFTRAISLSLARKQLKRAA